MKRAIWAGFLGSMLVAAMLLKIWDVAWVVDQGLISMTVNSDVPINELPSLQMDSSGGTWDGDTGLPLYGVATGTMDYTPIQVTGLGYVKAAGRYEGEMVKGWVPIAVDKEGRVVPSRQWVETELFKLDDQGRVVCSPDEDLPFFRLAADGGLEVTVTKGTTIRVQAEADGTFIVQLAKEPKRVDAGDYRPMCVGFGKEGVKTVFPCWLDRCKDRIEIHPDSVGIPCCIDEHGGVNCGP